MWIYGGLINGQMKLAIQTQHVFNGPDEPNLPSRPRHPSEIEIDHVPFQRPVDGLGFFWIQRYRLGRDDKVELQRPVGTDVEGVGHQDGYLLAAEAEGVGHVVEPSMSPRVVVLRFDHNGCVQHHQARLVEVYGVHLGSGDAHLGHLRAECHVPNEDYNATYNHQHG